MIRLVVYDRFGGFVKELAPADVFAATRSAQINGEDALDISTSDYLAKGQRVVYRDGMGRWHEYIVSGGDEAHDSGRSAVGTYHCENSWAELRTAPYIIDKRPGSQGAVSAQSALATALEGTRWEVGECDLVKTARTTWYHVSPWDAVADLVNVWGGQLRADIEVDGSGVVNRKLSLMQSIGLGPGVRFDYGADVSGITVTHDESDIYTALYCYGKGVETESGGYGRKIGIEEVNGGVPYVEDAEAKQIWGQIGPDGLDNAYGIYENGDCEDASQLKAEGIAALADASRPKVQYSATVVQFSRAGLDLRGATLGDRADIVDRSFYRSRGVDSDLRLSGVVVGVVENLLDPDSTSFTLGDIMGTIAQTLAGLSSGVGKLEAAAPTWNDAATNSTSYVNDLIDRLNQEINATGGYTYVKQGQGIWVYDKAEDQNPTKVINLMGGSMRIADSKTASGDWDWRSVFVSGHIAADLVTAASLVAGYIGSPDGGNYWNLDTGELRIASDTTIGGKQIATADAVTSLDNSLDQQGVFNRLTNDGQNQGIYLQNGILYINGQYIKTGIITDGSGDNVWNLDTGNLVTNNMVANNINANGTLMSSQGIYDILIKYAEITGYRSDVETGKVDFRAAISNPSGETWRGPKISGKDCIAFAAPKMFVSQTSNGNFNEALTDEITFSFRKAGSGTGSLTMRFINGLLTYFNLG